MFYFMTNKHEIIVLNVSGDPGRCCKLRGQFMTEPWWDSGVKVLENVGLFTFEGQINSFKQKEPSKLIYFKCSFDTNLVLYALIVTVGSISDYVTYKTSIFQPDIANNLFL